MAEKQKIKLTAKQFIYLLVYVSGGTSGYINVIMQDLIEAFPNTPAATVRLASSIGGLPTMITTILVGMIIGKVIKYKHSVILGHAAYFLFGILPFFLVGGESFTPILICRLLMGIASGFTAQNLGLLKKNFNATEAPFVIGWGAVVVTVIATLGQNICGFMVAAFGWKSVFLLHCLSLLSVLGCALGAKEPEPEEKKVEENAPKMSLSQFKVSGQYIFYIVIYIILTMVMRPVSIGMTTILTMRGLGTTAVRGTVISFYTLGGGCINLIFGVVNAKFKRWLLPVAATVGACGIGFILFADQLWMCMAGMFMGGMGFMCAGSAITAWASDVCSPESKGFANSICATTVSFACLFVSYWMSFVDGILHLDWFTSDVDGSLLVGMILYIAIAIMGYVKDLTPETLAKKVKALN